MLKLYKEGDEVRWVHGHRPRVIRSLYGPYINDLLTGCAVPILAMPSTNYVGPNGLVA
jgi:hypothetical protein